MITKHCQAKFAANVEFTPKVLDAGETMVLFNLPRPWILLCGQEKQPTEIDFATYKCNSMPLVRRWLTIFKF